jgi:CIC family chloride channel protein
MTSQKSRSESRGGLKTFPEMEKSLKNLLDVHSMARPTMLAVVVGLVAGLGALVFYFAANFVEGYFLHHLAGYHPPEEGAKALAHLGETAIDSLHMDHRWFLFLIPVIGGLVSGFLVFKFAPETEGHGTDAVIDACHQKGGYIRGRVPLIKGIASVATIGTGGSAGREGPIAQIGAGFGSFLATRLGLSAADRRILLLAGMAGGIGATFRSPLGGALFAVEVLYRDPEFEHEGLVPCIISSIIAYSLFGAVTGWQPLLDTPRFRFDHPRELILYLGLGILCALLGKFYVQVFYRTRDFFRRLRMPTMLKPALGGLLLGLLAMVVPQVLGSGYGLVQAALYGKIALWVMVVVAVAKILATSLTISSGGSGGVFAPSLVIGAMLGGAFGAAAVHFFPSVVQDPRAYVLVGMAGFFAGVANTPVATLIMVSELTGNYGLLAPLMLVCVVPMIVLRRNTIYENQVPSRIDSPAHLGEFVIDVLEGLKVSDLKDQGRNPTFIPEDLSLHEILQRIATADGAYYPVVNDQGAMTGIFSINDIRRILHEEIPPGLVLARDIAVARVVKIQTSDTLSKVLQKLSGRGLEEIPVVDEAEPGKVLFMLSRRAVLSRYAAELERYKGE